MNYLKWIGLILKLTPCIIGAAKAYEEAKKDDGEVDFAEGMGIADGFFKCVLEKMGITVNE